MLRGVGVWLPHFHWLITMQKHNHHLSCAIRIGEETGRPAGRQAGRPSRGSFFAFCARSPTTAFCVPSDLANLMLTDAPRRISISGKPASAVSGKRKQRQRIHTLCFMGGLSDMTTSLMGTVSHTTSLAMISTK